MLCTLIHVSCHSDCPGLATPLEPESEALLRKKQNRVSMASKRALDISLETAIANFHSKAKFGPDFVCTCCHRMMYRKSVVPCNTDKYTKASVEVIEKVFAKEFKHVCCDGRQWVCTTCDGALKRGNIPVQAKANGLCLQPIPPELNGVEISVTACSFYEHSGFTYW